MGTMAALWVGWEPRGSPCPPALPTTPSPAPHAAPPPHPITHSTTPPPLRGARPNNAPLPSPPCPPPQRTASGSGTHNPHRPQTHTAQSRTPRTPWAPHTQRFCRPPHSPPSLCSPRPPFSLHSRSFHSVPPLPALPVLPDPPFYRCPPTPTCSPTATRWPSAHAHCRLPSAPAPPFCPRAARARRAPREGSRRHRRSGKTEVSGPAGGGWRRERGGSAGKGGTAAIGRTAPPPSYLRAATAAMKRPASPLARPATNRRGEEGRCFAPLAERAVAPRRAGHASRSHVRRFAGGRHVGAGTWAARRPARRHPEAKPRARGSAASSGRNGAQGTDCELRAHVGKGSKGFRPPPPQKKKKNHMEAARLLKLGKGTEPAGFSSAAGALRLRAQLELQGSH